MLFRKTWKLGVTNIYDYFYCFLKINLYHDCFHRDRQIKCFTLCDLFDRKNSLDKNYYSLFPIKLLVVILDSVA